MKSSWTNSIGFYFAALGASFGLGNLWRFPYVVVENGGGAFVLLYVLLVFIVGMPLLMGELMLGKVMGGSLVSVTKHFDGFGNSLRDRFLSQNGKYFAKMAVGICLMVLAYFSVISGWVLYYVVGYFWSIFSPETMSPERIMSSLREQGWLQLALAGIHLIIVIFFAARRNKKNLEKWVGYIMPAFIVLLVGLMIKSISLDTSEEAIRVLLYPDFSKIKWSSLSYALGHVFFSLTLGFGTMVTFRRFLQDKAYIPSAGFRVVTMDLVLSLCSGFLIFPLVIQGTMNFSGPELLFQTVPVFLGQIPRGNLFGVGFFLFLYLAALGSSIGLLKTVIDNTGVSQKNQRTKAALFIGALCFALSIVPAFSSSTLGNITYNGKGILEILDIFLINWMLPISALLISQLICYGIAQKRKEEVFLVDGGMVSPKVFSHWEWSLKWVVPGVICASLALQIYDFFY